MAALVDLTGRRILVTGASSGIGQATAILLSELGAKIVLIGRNQEELLKTKSLMESSGHHQVVLYDLSCIEGMDGLYESIFKFDKQKLSGLVHAAGISKVIPLRSMGYKDLDELMRVNYYSFIALVRGYSMKKHSQGGSIVAVSSIVSTQPGKYQSIYAASKAALDVTVRSLSMELISKNIRINSVLPGAVDTNMVKEWNKFDPDYLKRIENLQLMGIGQPKQIANVIAFLLSDAASFVTGRNYYADGGQL